MEKNFALGIDIGGTNIAWGIIDAQGTCHHQGKCKTADFSTVEALASYLYNICAELQVLNQLKGIGIGTPAANAKKGAIMNASNLPWKGIIPIQSIFENQFSLKVCINNDANICAIGEMRFGAAQGLKHFAVVTVGTGIGAGIVYNGELVEGFDGNGGEFGHIVLIPDGRACGCGRYGCLETYTSSKGIVNTAREMLLEDTTSLLHQISNDALTSERIFEKASQGDALSQAAFRKTGMYLGWGIANMVTLLGLEKVLLYGGPVKAGELLVDAVREAFEKQVIHYYKDNVKVDYTSIPADKAAIVGAAAMLF